MGDTFLGIDFGTSGARAVVINAEGQLQAQASATLDQQTPEAWRWALFELIQALPSALRQNLRSIAINGTSSTVLLCDPTGIPVAAPILYHDDRGAAMLEQIRTIAPANHTVVSATSSLAKLLWWLTVETQGSIASSAERYFLHQADWLGFLLHGQLGVSDYHNALKLGYDVEQLRYPDWLTGLNLPVHLPKVLTPGTPVAQSRADLATELGIGANCLICAGTTDSIAAFLASGATAPGEAVTSLGSTLVLKLLSQHRVEDARYGIYSHRLGALWLVGGASNTGGAVLKQFFDATELEQLSQQIQPDCPSPLDYYPLLKPGERFPVNDPNLAPRLTPRPEHPVEFLQGLLESMARIEAHGYRLLQTLGATPLQQVLTAGGGAQNSAWTAIRARHLQVPVQTSVQTEAAYGTALLAQRSV
jgi:D-ribulokinase